MPAQLTTTLSPPSFACAFLSVAATSVFRGHVGAEVAAGAELGGRRVAFLVVDVEQRDLAAVRDEMLCDREAETGCAAGDDGLDLIELHGITLRMRGRGF